MRLSARCTGLVRLAVRHMRVDGYGANASRGVH